MTYPAKIPTSPSKTSQTDYEEFLRTCSQTCWKAKVEDLPPGVYSKYLYLNLLDREIFGGYHIHKTGGTAAAKKEMIDILSGGFGSTLVKEMEQEKSSEWRWTRETFVMLANLVQRNLIEASDLKLFAQKFNVSWLVKIANEDRRLDANHFTNVRNAQICLQHLAEWGHPTAQSALEGTRHYPALKAEKAQDLKRKSCYQTPFCFAGEFASFPELRLGYEAIFAKGSSYEMWNPSFKWFFLNRRLEDTNNKYALGIAPGIHYHGGAERKAVSLGLTFRVSRLLNYGFGDVGFALPGLSLDLELHGGAGSLNTLDNGIHYRNTAFGFGAVDALLSGRLYLISAYVGGGLRVEHWQAGQDSLGKDAGPMGAKVFPALVLGGGYP